MSTPRAIDVCKLAEARIREILSIHDQVKGLTQDDYGVRGLPRGLRRRSRSHKRYRRGGRRPNVQKGKDSEDRFLNRRMRRKKSFNACMNPWEKGAMSPGEVCRLPTHVFHAKRMSMSKVDRWNFVVPEGACGCGQGTRSFKHRLEKGCIVHDASYWCSIELLGSTEELRSILSDLSNYLSPEYVGEQSSSQQLADLTGRDGSSSMGPLQAVACESGRVIIWAHCEYAVLAIREMCENVKKSDRVDMKLGRLGRIEVRGPVSERILRKIGEKESKVPLPAIENYHNEPSLGETCVWSVYDRGKKSQAIYSASSDLSNGLVDIVSGLLRYCIWSDSQEKEYCVSDDFITIAVIRNSSGYSIFLNRETYQVVFKAICLSGAFIAGQREWHWYHTLNKLAFYPDDYLNSHHFGSTVETFAARLEKHKNFPSNLIRQSQTFLRSERLSRVAIWIIKNGTLRQGDILCAIESREMLPSHGKMRIDTMYKLIKRGDSTIATEKDIHGWDVNGIVTSPCLRGVDSKHPSIGLLANSVLSSMKNNRIILWAWAQDRQLIFPVLVKVLTCQK